MAVGSKPDADDGIGRRGDGLTADIESAVEPPLHGRHADRVGVEHAGGVRVVAQFRRVARDKQEVADAAGGAGQQVGLHADQVAVAATEVQHRLDVGLAENPLRRDQRGNTGAGAGRREC